ncbi:MAG: hypothetical protein GY858_10025 [Candidatus Omnitrophica bacterium]|nr:hypothetical protein [Candidatus Omnitrophota bacterium]
MKKASMLIFTIWMMLLFSLLALGIYRMAVARMQVAKRIEQIMLSDNAAKAACEYMVLQIANDSTYFDSLEELKTPVKIELGVVEMEIYLNDEAAKININTASRNNFEKLPGLNDDIAGAIIKARMDQGNFSFIEDLLLLSEISEEKFQKIKKFITVNNSSKININTAGRVVLAAIGFEDWLIDEIIYYRKGKDGVEATTDDGKFQDLDKDVLCETLNISSQNWLKHHRAFGQLVCEGGAFEMCVATNVLGNNVFNYAIILSEEGVIKWQEM